MPEVRVYDDGECVETLWLHKDDLPVSLVDGGRLHGRLGEDYGE